MRGKLLIVLDDAFRAFATCDYATLDKLMVQIGQAPKPRKAAKKN